jgi:protoporphyrin/coproporphyrin ferrochelatase
VNVVVLSNLGTPSAPTDGAVGVYLKEFLYDPDVIPLPAVLRYPLVHWLIVPRRAKQSAAKYREIWTDQGSPLLVWGKALRDEVAKHSKAPVLLGMRYGDPSFAGAIQEAKKLGASQITFVPLYPQYAEATSGSSTKYFLKLAQKEGFGGKVKIFSAFPKAPFFVKPAAEKIRALLQPESHLLLSYHGLPEKQLQERHCHKTADCCERSIKENISCYRAHCLATSLEIARLLGLPKDRWTMSFQSRFGRDKWIGPHTEDLLKSLPASGKKDLVLAAPSFVADCLETIEELGIQGRRTFMQAGGEQFTLVPCLNGDPDFARGLAEAIRVGS